MTVVTVTSATLEEGKQAGCEDKSGSLNTYNRSFIKFHDLEIPSFFLSNKTRKEPVKSLPVFWHKSKLSPGSKHLFGHPPTSPWVQRFSAKPLMSPHFNEDTPLALTKHVGLLNNRPLVTVTVRLHFDLAEALPTFVWCFFFE